VRIYPRKRVQYVTKLAATQIDPEQLGDEVVLHYSIPSLQESGKPAKEPASDIASNKWLLKGGEVLVSKLNVHKNCVAIAGKEDTIPIVASTEFVPLEPVNVDPTFLAYVFQSTETIELLTSLSESATRSHSRVNPSDIIKFKIPQPPLETQRRIADYLDRETARIDALVAEKEKMLALLEEKRTALISRAVTRGLDPNVPMKPSGLDWLGDIPAHWKLERAKHLFSVRDERSEEGDEELLTVSHITGVTPRSEKEVYMFQAEDKTGYKKCYPGDLVINTLWAWMGAMGVSPLEGIVSPDYHVYTSKGQLLPEFIELLCRSKPFLISTNVQLDVTTPLFLALWSQRPVRAGAAWPSNPHGG